MMDPATATTVAGSIMSHGPLHVMAIWFKIWQVKKIINNLGQNIGVYKFYTQSSIEWKITIFLNAIYF